jgi:hypothetical protein
MKNKLRKDLKFLNTVKGKLIPSLVLGFYGTCLTIKPEVSELWKPIVWIYTLVIALPPYIALYFFNAWIVGDEEEPKK